MRTFGKITFLLFLAAFVALIIKNFNTSTKAVEVPSPIPTKDVVIEEYPIAEDEQHIIPLDVELDNTWRDYGRGVWCRQFEVNGFIKTICENTYGGLAID